MEHDKPSHNNSPRAFPQIRLPAASRRIAVGRQAPAARLPGRRARRQPDRKRKDRAAFRAVEQAAKAVAHADRRQRARSDAAQAAFANAISSHSIELDDIDVLALFHFSPPVFSAALAAAEQHGANGKQLLVALAAGCEMMERVSRAANPSLRNRGFHTTPTCGVFGATVAAAKLQRLSPAKLTSAFGLAGAQASGLMEMYGPSMQKRFNPGPAARNGVTAAADGAARIHRRRHDIRRRARLSQAPSPTKSRRVAADRRHRQALPARLSSSSRIRARARSTMRSIARSRSAARQTGARRDQAYRDGAPSRLGALPPEQGAAHVSRGAGVAAVFGRGRAQGRAGAAQAIQRPQYPQRPAFTADCGHRSRSMRRCRAACRAR